MKFNFIFFSVVTAIILVLIFIPLQGLLSFKSGGMYYEYYSHVYLIPLVSAYLIYVRRSEIWQVVKPSYPAGIWVGLLGLVGYVSGLVLGKNLEFINQAAWQITALLVVWLGAFLLFFGKEAFKSAIFPLLFLVFLVPIPKDLMDGFIYALQVGSSEATAALFSLLGVSYYREGFIFQMGKVTIEIARECSGIRSTMALVITGILAAHLFLQDSGKKLILMLTILPITVFKNGIRIVILTLLAIHVDERFLTGGFLHKSGGFLFYIPGLIIFGGILLLLRKIEKRNEKKMGDPGSRIEG
jgi:exosortase